MEAFSLDRRSQSTLGTAGLSTFQSMVPKSAGSEMPANPDIVPTVIYGERVNGFG